MGRHSWGSELFFAGTEEPEHSAFENVFLENRKTANTLGEARTIFSKLVSQCSVKTKMFWEEENGFIYPLPRKVKSLPVRFRKRKFAQEL